MEREHFLVRMVRLLGLLALAVSALVYPLQLDNEWTAALYFRLQSVPYGPLLFANLEPTLRFGYSPLVVKETLASWVLLPLLACWLTWRLALSGRPLRRRAEGVALVAFLLWGLLATLRAPHLGYDSECFYTVFDFILWILVFLAVSDLPASERFGRTLVRCFLLIGLVLMLISLAESFESTSRCVFKVLLKNDTDRYQRNLYGSLIGHNTGVASIAMGPFFFALGAFFAARRPSVRLGLGLYVLIALWFFQITKSRAVWLLIPPLTVVYLLGLGSILGFRVRLRHFLAGILIVATMVLALIAGSRAGIMQGHVSDYMARLRAMAPETLVKGTRVRIVRIGYDLVKARPFAGHGLAAFVPLYPQAQADYFERHPDSPFQPTDLLTLEAHNDYLQLLIETGFIGVGLALAAIVLHLRRGLGRWRRLDPARREERLRRYSAFFAVCATMLHAFVDFPFHLAPLTTSFLFAVALALGSPDEDEDEPSAESPAVGPDVSEPSSGRGELFQPLLRVRKVAVLSIILVGWGLVVPGAMFTGRRLLADMHALRANGNLEYAVTLSDEDERRRALSEAYREFSLSLRIDPLQYIPRIQMGQLRFRLALLFDQDFGRALKAGNRRRAALERQGAITYLEDGIRDLQRASFMIDSGPADGPTSRPLEVVGPRVNRVLTYALARSWALYAELDPMRTDASGNAFRAYQETVRQAPNLASAIVETLGYMESKGLGDKAYRHRLYDLLARYEPEELAAYATNRSRAFLDCEADDRAARDLEDILEAVGDRKNVFEVPLALAGVYMVSGEKEKYRELVERIAREFPDREAARFLVASDSVLRGRYAEAETMLRESEPGDPNVRERWTLLHAEVLRVLGRADEAEALDARVLRGTPSPGNAYFTRAEGRRYLLDRADEALDDYERAIRCYPPGGSASAYLVLLRAYSDRENWGGFDRVLALAKLSIRDNPILESIERETAARRGRESSP
ncbi:O-antigen ligase family protein [Candidatus Sumerlaeota bacterium]|nr:O-antigen ligase family protein [Candidatus Sumerlaeota bacterium]